ncbi:hypothetical protein JZ751_021384 [Albula glossodonta]|uniref:Uncharacterized protein n=1 Tax=Albula glossodonta TaxID=121402 RepID=A0A8T2NSG4_9TELE|nr:hypothetical protein JZ751_021384 [Albula glossodonta]
MTEKTEKSHPHLQAKQRKTAARAPDTATLSTAPGHSKSAESDAAPERGEEKTDEKFRTEMKQPLYQKPSKADRDRLHRTSNLLTVWGKKLNRKKQTNSWPLGYLWQRALYIFTLQMGHR